VLGEYSAFVATAREYQKTMSLRKALGAAIDYCIDNGILVDFLSQHGSEVRNMLFAEWKLKDALVVAGEEAREEGIGIGEVRGEQRGIKIGEERGEERGLKRGREEERKESRAWFLDMLKQGLSVEEIERQLTQG
jgi:hypothetical protein